MPSNPAARQADGPGLASATELPLNTPSTATAGARSITDVVRDIVARHGRLSVPIEQVTNGSDLYSAGLTSLATVGLMLALEEGFDIEFPDALLSRRTFGSIDTLAGAVETLCAR